MVTLITITAVIVPEPIPEGVADASLTQPMRTRALARLNPELLRLVLALIQKASLSDSAHPLTSHDIEKMLAETAPNITLDSEEVDEIAKDLFLNKVEKEEDPQTITPEIFASRSHEKGKIDLTFVLHNRLSPEISITALEKKIENLIHESLKGEKQPAAVQSKEATIEKTIENPPSTKSPPTQTKQPTKEIANQPPELKEPLPIKERIAERDKVLLPVDRYATEAKEAQSIKVHAELAVSLPTQHVIVNITSPYAVYEDKGKKKKNRSKKRKKSTKQKKRLLGKLLKKVFGSNL